MDVERRSIYQLIQLIIDYIGENQAQAPNSSLILDKLASMDLTEPRMSAQAPCSSRHDAILEQAITNLTAPPLSSIAKQLKLAKPHLTWREDNGLYYTEGADLGEGYRSCNLHTLLIGPGACGFEHPDFNLGIFMLGPRTLYRDHKHAAPELYVNLSERSGWRLRESIHWQDYPVGSLIWNASNEVHATRVYEQPFLSIFAWLHDVQEPCEVVIRDDWAEIEESLTRL